ncbi:tryptophan halogenase family protein [Paraglaciecola sp. L3A3]|uniref:tryptophan halogenase family protein n=1 Tax=Paraglaciecola sp. L3A3 TaxID=2686358 RepID=UPI00131DD2F3|nr:tryptophan halogenase family protein [Paraglaciecola sp. L3A3]
MQNKINKVVIVGGGTAGWISAALLKKILGNTVTIELVESEAIGTVGVGEATIPPIRLLNKVLGLNEAEFIKETKATIKLGIMFENWRVPNEQYFHSFGVAGKNMAFCQFHHYCSRANQLGFATNLWNYDANYLAAMQGKFGHINSQNQSLELPYAYHFDATLYAKYLRKVSQGLGVKRTEGMVDSVSRNVRNGYIEKLRLQSGQEVAGDLFIDCSGFRGLLIQQELATGYEDWSHWLPCDRAVAIPTERFEKTLPYTRSIAHKAGWQWRIPLQHRNGNGLVYSSAHYSEAEAEALLMSNLESKPLAEPNFIRFKTGRRRKQWNKNVVAVGLSSGFLEPLESTSIHLIQSAIVRLTQLFPHNGIDNASVVEYNKQSTLEFEQIRDFLILHYHVNERTDSQFWRDLGDMEIPNSLAHKIALFRDSGTLFREQNDLFLESSWLQVMQGQGITPKDYHPIANNVSEQKLTDMLAHIKQIKHAYVKSLPSHDEFLKSYCNL